MCLVVGVDISRMDKFLMYSMLYRDLRYSTQFMETQFNMV